MGGESIGALYEQASDAAVPEISIKNNEVKATNSNFMSVTGAGVIISDKDTDVTIDISNNKVEIDAGNNQDMNDTIIGAFLDNNGNSLSGATVSGNEVTLKGVRSNFVVGAQVFASDTKITGNTVNIKDGKNTDVAGAFANGDNNTLTNNTVNLSGNTEFVGQTFEEEVFDPQVYAAMGFGEGNTVSNNTVNVSDNVKLDNTHLFGRLGDNLGSGNMLNLNNWKGSIKSVNYFDNLNMKTSSAEPEQVVIQDLNKGTADTKINIGLDDKAARELESKAPTAKDAAIQASKVLKLVNVDGNQTHNETFNVNIAEGDVTGEITAVIEENGTVDKIDVKDKPTPPEPIIKVITEKENSVIKSLTNIAANNFLVFRSQMNDLNKRMGDLRTMPEGDGVWGRAIAGQSEYKQMHSTHQTLQVGADKRVGQFLIGATASYTDADGSLKNGSSDDKNYTYGIYGSWLGDNGHYVDVIVKRHHVQSDYDLRYKSGLKADGKMHTSGTSVSAEYGKRFSITNTNFYVEPQVEVMWGKLDSDSYKLSNGVKISQDSIDSLVGRLGIAAGWVSPDKKGSAYIKASVLNDWEADADIKAKKGATVRKYSEDMGGTWGEFAIGGTYNFCKNFSAYGEIETTAGNPVRTTYQASAGIRYSF